MNEEGGAIRVETCHPEASAVFKSGHCADKERKEKKEKREKGENLSPRV